MSSRDHIVITGAGLVSPLGLTREATWQAVLQRRCGMGPLSALESPLPQCADGGQAPELPSEFEPSLARETRYLRFTIRQALADARIGSTLPYPAERCGIVLGTTLHGMRSGGRFLRTGDHALLGQFLAGPVLKSAAADLNFVGAALTTCSACSSSLGSIALGVTLLESGQLDLVIAGGYDTISEYVYGGFNSLRLVASGPPRPFARDRQGMKLAEGYGIVVLERAEDARRRSQPSLAKILGYGESADAHHLTQPHPQGEGAARAIEAALRVAGLRARDIDLIAAHATGTPDNDASEFAALRRVFGEQLPRVPVVAFKSHLGHTLGGAGAVELILSAMALRDQTVPACPNIGADDLEFEGLALSTGSARRSRLRATLNLSLGFGGANTCMILGRADDGAKPDGPATDFDELSRTGRLPRAPAQSHGKREVLVTGIGVLFPGIIGNDAFVARLRDPFAAFVTEDTGPVPDAQIASLLNARRVRRMSEYVKVSLAAAMLCLRDAGIADGAAFAEPCAAILGSAHGSTNYCEAYYREIVKSGLAAANPMLFAEGVPNAAAAHLSLMLSLKGPCQTIIGTRTAGLDAMRLASARIESGEWDRAIVGAAEEYSPIVNAAYGHWGLYGSGGFVAGSGAVTFLLESRASLQARGGRARGRVVSAAASRSVRMLGEMLRRSISRDVQRPHPTLMIGSGTGTWIDRCEAAVARKLGATLISPYGCVAECFSALPLAGIAGALLAGDFSPAQRSFCAIGTDYTGAMSGLCFERLQEKG